MSGPKILLSGYYGYDNAGDEAILYSIIYELKNKGFIPMVLSGNPEKTAKQYSVIAYDRTDLDEAIFECDGLISGGGSLLQDITSLRSIPRYLEVIQKAQKLNKPTFFYAQGIGPMRHKPFFTIVKETLERCDYLSVRDEDSLQFLKQVVGVENPIDLTVDPVLFIEGLNQNAKLEASLERFLEKHPIVISIRPWGDNSHIIKEFSGILERLNHAGQPVLFLPFQPVYDLPLAEEIIKGFSGDLSLVYIVRQELDLNQYFTIINKSKLMVGMRLHALIFAACLNVPFYGISYDPKTVSFLKQFGKNPTVQAENFLGEMVLKEMTNVLDNLNIEKQRMKNTLLSLKARASLPINAIVSYFYKST